MIYLLDIYFIHLFSSNFWRFWTAAQNTRNFSHWISDGKYFMNIQCHFTQLCIVSPNIYIVNIPPHIISLHISRNSCMHVSSYDIATAQSYQPPWHCMLKVQSACSGYNHGAFFRLLQAPWYNRSHDHVSWFLKLNPLHPQQQCMCLHSSFT